MAVIESFDIVMDEWGDIEGPPDMNEGSICGLVACSLWDFEHLDRTVAGVIEMLTPDEYDDDTDIMIWVGHVDRRTPPGERQVYAASHSAVVCSSAVCAYADRCNSGDYVPIAVRLWLYE